MDIDRDIQTMVDRFQEFVEKQVTKHVLLGHIVKMDKVLLTYDNI